MPASAVLIVPIAELASLQTVEQMVDRIMELPPRTKIQVLAPRSRGGREHSKLLASVRADGVRAGGREIRELEEDIQ